MSTRGSSARPLTSVLTQVVSEVAYLLQTEIRLARAEISEKLSRAANGGAMLGIAAILSLCGLFVLLLGAVRWLEIAGVPDQWGMLIVGGAALLIAIVLALVGARNLKGSALKPERTIEQVRAAFSIAKEHVQ
jgi:Putative Actinobacterial Holin-X, holin superfamily III